MNHLSGAMKSYGLLVVIFFALILVLPASELVMQNYNISSSQYHVLLFLVELPLAVVWFAAFFGYGKLKEYISSIANTPEAQGFNKLARGCAWLAWGLPLISIVSVCLNSLGNSHHGFHSTAIIIVNYLNLIVPVVAFSIMSEATRELIVQTKLRVTFSNAKFLQLGFVVLGVLYCYFIFRQLDLATVSSSDNPYYLPVWLFVITIIIPSLYAWFVGLLAAFNIYLLAKHSKGIFYRKALRLIAGGLVAVIMSLIGVQYLRSVVPRTGHLSIDAVVVIIYAIYAITVAGFVLMAVGSSKLKKIEEI